MATKVKSAADVAKKWAEQTPGRQAYYEAGVKAAGADWENAAIAAAPIFKAAVSAGNIDKMYSGGVKNAGAAKYVRKAGGVGAQRFSGGVSAGVEDFTKGITSVLAVIAGVTPPVRAPRGAESNLARVRAYSIALHADRLARKAAGA